MSTQSYLGKTFLIDNPDARVRHEKNLLQFITYQAGDDIPSGKKVGDPRVIPQGTQVKITDAKALDEDHAFVLAEPLGEGVVTPFGWTSTKNLKGRFVSETLGQFPPTDNNKKGANAAWDAGTFIGQKTLVDIMGNNDRVKRVILDTLAPYLALADAAAKDGVTLALNSGFRSYPEQEFLFKMHNLNPKKFATAAEPGKSNHQDGQAFDIQVGGFDGSPIYDWLKVHAPKLGFIRTVSNEPWLWEFRPQQAAKLAAKGLFKAANVKDKPLKK